MKSAFSLTVWGYVLIGAASNGFYQQRFFSDTGMPSFFWPLVAIVGIGLLGIKNRFLDKGVWPLLVDLCYVLPTVLIPLTPLRHDWAMVAMLVYACTFLIVFIFRNFKNKGS